MKGEEILAELDDHKPDDKSLQDEVEDLGGLDPDLMVLGKNATQEEFDRIWREGDTITEDGYLTERSRGA